MADDGDSSWLSPWETGYLANFSENQNDIVDNLEQENLDVQAKLWGTFQKCATSIAKVYVERENQKNGTDAFRVAARDATLLYKDGVDMSRKLSEMGMATGYNRRTKEILQWVRKRRRFIKRDELIAMLCGQPGSGVASQPQQQQPPQTPQRKTPPNFSPNEEDSHLDTFREAIQSIGNGVATHASVTEELSLGPPFSRSPPYGSGRKRSSSPMDVNMDSPSHKRQRYL